MATRTFALRHIPSAVRTKQQGARRIGRVSGADDVGNDHPELRLRLHDELARRWVDSFAQGLHRDPRGHGPTLGLARSTRSSLLHGRFAGPRAQSWGAHIYVVAGVCHLPIKRTGDAFPNPASWTEFDLVKRVRDDTPYWESLVAKGRALQVRESSPGRNAEIERLCSEGSRDAFHWMHLANTGPHAVDHALEGLARRRAWSELLGVFMHALHDKDRALQVFLTHRSECPDLNSARAAMAMHLSETNPALAADLLFEQAEACIQGTEKSRYRETASYLANARDILASGGSQARWADLMDDFQRRHGHDRMFVAALRSITGASATASRATRTA